MSVACHWRPRLFPLPFRLVAAALVLLAGCSSLDPLPPPGYNLSGNWALDSVESDPLPGPRAGAGAPAVDHDGLAGHRRARALAVTGARMVAVRRNMPEAFALRMVIVQDRRSMGVDVPGVPYQDISWGRHDRNGWDVDAGWDQGNLVVRRRQDDTRLESRWWLAADGRQLTVMATLPVGPNSEARTVRRVFNRLPDLTQAAPADSRRRIPPQ